MVTSFKGLGLVAKHRRNIADGKAFDKYFGKPDGKRVIINAAASVFDTLDAMETKIKATLSQTKPIAKVIASSTSFRNGSVRTDFEPVLKRLFDFAYNHIQYKEDAQGLEQIRTPNVIWAERKTGVDCDDFAIFCSSILSNLGIQHSLRICELSNKGYYQHVYVVVPKQKGANMKVYSGEYFTVDPVLDKFNQEAPSITKIHDKIMTIPLQSLSGLGEATTTRRVITPATDSDNNRLTLEVLKPMKDSLTQMILDMRKNQSMYSGLYDVPKMMSAIRYALANWNDEKTRTAALEKLATMDDQLMSKSFNNNKKTLAGLYGMTEDQLESTLFGIDLGELDQAFGLSQIEGLGSVAELEGLGKAKLFAKVAAVAKKATTGVKKVTTTAFQKGIKPAAKATATGVKVGAKAVAKAASTTGKAVVKAAKVVAKVATKVTLAPARTVYRGLVALNVRGWATAMKKLIDTKQDGPLKAKWTGLPISGNWGDLVSAINTGAGKKPVFGSKKGVTGLNGTSLGVVDIAAAVATSAPIVALLVPLFKNLLPSESSADSEPTPTPTEPVVSAESTSSEGESPADGSGEGMSTTKKIAIFGGLGLLTVAGIYFGTKSKAPASKLSGPPATSKPKKALKSKYKKTKKVTI